MQLSVIGERYFLAGLLNAVKFDARDAARHRVRILNFDSIRRAAAPLSDFELTPEPGDARIDAQAVALQLKPEDVFQRRAIHPSR